MLKTLRNPSNPPNSPKLLKNFPKLQSPHFSAVHLSPSRRRVCTRMLLHASCPVHAYPYVSMLPRTLPKTTQNHPTHTQHTPNTLQRQPASFPPPRPLLPPPRPLPRCLLPPAATGLITPCALESRLARETRMRQPSYPPGVPAAPPTAAERRRAVTSPCGQHVLAIALRTRRHPPPTRVSGPSSPKAGQSAPSTVYQGQRSISPGQDNLHQGRGTHSALLLLLRSAVHLLPRQGSLHQVKETCAHPTTAHQGLRPICAPKGQ